MEWHTDRLQAVLFVSPSATQMDALQAWNSAMPGEGPEGFQKATTGLVAGSFAQGFLDDFRLTISVNLGRLDLVVTKDPDPEAPDQLPRMTDLRGALMSLSEPALRLLASTRVVRLAIVANLGRIIADGETIDEVLKETTGVWFPSPALDCVYQYNIRRTLETDNTILLNRVVTTAAGEYQMRVAPPELVAQGLPLLESYAVKAYPMVSYKLDVNTATNEQIKSDARAIYAEIHREVVDLAGRRMRDFR